MSPLPSGPVQAHSPDLDRHIPPLFVLRAKLKPPRIGRDVVVRQRLLDRLDAGLASNLTLVSAPAGFGKTTALAAWFEQSPRRAAWLSLDAGDNQVARFVADLIEAIRTVYPEACRTTSVLLQMPQLVPTPLLASLLSNDLEVLPDELIVVLDDYHTIDDADVHALVSELASRPPRSLHLVIGSRMDPPLPVARLRAAGRLTRLHSVDLRFTNDETWAFVTQAAGLDLDGPTVAKLHARTEGWITGLRLATISLVDHVDRAAFVETFADDNRDVMDFLLSEVLSRQEPAVQQFLLVTSLVERFCAPLCDALLSATSAQGQSQNVLDWIEQANLFIVPLDDRRDWYRYHHLFRGLLRRRLRAQTAEAHIAALHHRAGDWFAGRGMVEEAVYHLLLVGDLDGAAQLVEKNVHPLLNREEWSRLQRVLDLLPDALVQARPALLVARAWVFQLANQPADIPPLLDAAEALLDRGGPSAQGDGQAPLRGEIDALSAHTQASTGNENRASEDRARRGVERIPSEHAYARSIADMALAVSRQRLGKQAAAVRDLDAILAQPSGEHPARVTRALGGLVYVHMATGETHQTERVARELLRVGQRHGLSLSEGWAHYFLGTVLYEWDELAAAAAHLSAVIPLRDRIHLKLLRNAILGLALIQHRLGDSASAERTLDEQLGFAELVPGPQYVGVIRSFRVHLALLRGRSGDAMRALRTIDLDRLAPPDAFDMEVPGLTEARVLTAFGTEASLRAALRKLAELASWHERRHETYFLIQTLASWAVTLAAAGDTAAALAMLERALALAWPRALVRTFLDLGPPMCQLLSQCTARDETMDYVGRLLAQFPEPASAPARSTPSTHRELVQDLTQREAEILELLEGRLSNKEIARQLVISPSTVKRHTVNLYQKLQVNDRLKAVARARALGLLPDTDSRR